MALVVPVITVPFFGEESFANTVQFQKSFFDLHKKQETWQTLVSRWSYKGVGLNIMASK